VYQEDVIKIAHHFGGLDMGEADVLRRAMSGKYRGGKGFEKIKGKFFDNCKNFGYPDDITREVWRQIESFGGYSFSKAHSASFAVESYQSLYLKTYHPIEFMVAVINNFGGFYSTELYFHELKRAGAKLHAPCVNSSDSLSDIKGIDVHMGFTHIRDLQSNSVELILKERSGGGNFVDLQDFIERINLGIEQISILIRADAFRFTGKNKKTLLWEAHFIQSRMKQKLASEIALFNEPVKAFRIPQLEQQPFEDALDQIELFGFPLDDCFDLVDCVVSEYITADAFQKNIGKTINVLGYFITAKPTTTTKGDQMYFGTFLDSKGQWVDSVHFPNVADKYALQGNGFYAIKGKVVEEFDVYSIEVQTMKKVGLKLAASC
ncbi:MAG: helix-hairpin-helix domain-containing protein, partial [Flavisolibacter sp.]